MRKLKYILIFLIIALAAINTILYFAAVKLEEAVVSPAPIQMEEVLPEDAIVTGVCTFGDCPVATNISDAYKTSQVETSQNIATTSQSESVKESFTTELVSETYTLVEFEEETEPVAT